MAIIGGSSGIVPGQLLGTTTNDSASAGNVGEIVTASLARASATALTTGAFKTVTSVSLTSGDWDVFGMVGFVNGATTNVTVLFGNWSLVNNTQDTTPGTFWQISSPTTSGTVYGNDMIFPMPAWRFSLASTTTIYLVADANFTVSTCSAFGNIRARRVR